MDLNGELLGAFELNSPARAATIARFVFSDESRIYPRFDATNLL
jgi:hypothetical protein